MTLSTENCENISAEGATVANVGADKQISYTVLPVKGLDAEVTAEVRDFEMDAIAINGIKLDLDIEVDDKELMEKVTEIMNAARDLDDGAASLQASLSYEKYMASLKEAGLDLTQLQAGNTAAIQTLTAQINELSAAMEQIKSIPGYESDETCMGQLAQLEAQVPSLSNIVTLLGGSNAAILGTAQYFEAVQGGATELVNGLAQLDGSYEQFDAAIANLVNSVSGIADKVGALKAGVDQLAESYGSLNDGTKEFHEKTDGMDSEIEDKIDDMLNTISRSDAEIRSFVSEKKTNVESVQFVIKTGAIEKPEVVQTVEDETQELNLWEKFLRLFGR